MTLLAKLSFLVILMLKPAKRSLLQTCLLCAMVVLVVMQKHSGFLLILVVLLLAPSFLRSLYDIFIKRQQVKLKAAQTLIWLMTCLGIAGVHYHLHQTAREQANQVVGALHSYRYEQGHYPQALEELRDVSAETSLYYANEDGQPILFYRATWIVFETYFYDFNKQEWQLQG